MMKKSKTKKVRFITGVREMPPDHRKPPRVIKIRACHGPFVWAGPGQAETFENVMGWAGPRPIIS